MSIAVTTSWVAGRQVHHLEGWLSRDLAVPLATTLARAMPDDGLILDLDRVGFSGREAARAFVDTLRALTGPRSLLLSCRRPTGRLLLRDRGLAAPHPVFRSIGEALAGGAPEASDVGAAAS